jgi:hypothetical protein
MKKFIALFILLLVFAVSFSAQTECPTISIEGPKGFVPEGQTERYTVTVAPIESGWSLRYKWSVSPGELVSGQNSPTIEVLRTERYRGLTVTAEIFGLPEERNCPISVSETSVYDPAPQAVKIGVWKSEKEQTLLKRFAEELATNPDNQGYAIIIRGPSSTPQSLAELRKAIEANSPPPTGQWSRVTIIDAEGPEEIAELWRVPPGAGNPNCGSCKPAECPTITVTGPAGIWLPEESISFVASVGPSELKNLTFHWTVDGGDLIDGQGKSLIRVKTRKTLDPRITVAVRVTGLPTGCPATASEVASFVIDPTYILLDEHSTSPKEISKSSIDKLAKHLADSPDRYGYIIEYFSPKTSKAVIQRKIGLIKSYLLKRGQAENEYKVVIAQADRPSTKVFVIPPGVDFPQP